MLNSDEQQGKVLEILKEGYSNINYFTNHDFILRMLLINPDGLLILDFNPHKGETSGLSGITSLVCEADPDQLAAFISSIFKQSYDLSLKTTQLKIERHDLVTQEGVTIALYGIISDDKQVREEDEIKGFLGIWIDPKKGEDVIFRKGALKLVYNLRKVL